MSRTSQLAKHIQRTVTGPTWHGPALAQVLEGVAHDHAAAKPIAGAHSIWEIVLHVAAWADIARARLKGQSTGDPTPEEDWPPVPGSALGSDPQVGPDAASSDPASDWQRAVERLAESHRLLAADVRHMADDEMLDAKVKDLGYSVSTLLRGVVEHGAYHGGQIALLKRAAQSGQDGRPARA